MQMANQAATMAQRGMLYAANTELVKGLTLISQALDVQQGTSAHSAALTVGLTALQEARDFASAGSQISPFTRTRPARISASAPRRDAIPARAR